MCLVWIGVIEKGSEMIIKVAGMKNLALKKKGAILAYQNSNR